MNCKKESEKTLEARLVSEVRKRGGIALKLTSQFHRGMPDRLVLLPYHTIAFVELKSTGEKPRPLQEVAISQLKAFRFTVRVVDSTESLDDLMKSFDERMKEQEALSDEYNQKRKAAGREYLQKRRTEKMEEKIRKELQDEV